MACDLSLILSAGSRLLHRLVRQGLWPATELKFGVRHE
jgi:hypothetical protein